MRIIDAHHHLWNAGLHPHPWLEAADATRLPRVAGPADWSAAIAGYQVTQSVCVQAGSSFMESHWLLSQVGPPAVIAGIVIQHSVGNPAFGAALGAPQAFAGQSAVVGVRDPDLLTRAPGRTKETDEHARAAFDLLASAGLPLDVLAGPGDLPRVTALARAHPGTTFVVDHLGRPPLTGCALSRREWGRAFADLGRCPNVLSKVSGLPAGDHPRTAAAVTAAIRWAVDCLGPARLMFGSDWPVTTPTGGYQAAVSRLRDAVADLTPRERNDIFAGTAQRCYGLSPKESAMTREARQRRPQ